MKTVKLKIILPILFIAILLILLANFFKNLSIPENKYIERVTRSFPTQDSGYDKTSPITLYAAYPVTQKIVAGSDDFDQINIAFENFSKLPADSVFFSLGDENCHPLYEKKLDRLSFWLATDSIYTRLRFPAISDSAGKTYCLQFTFTPAEFRSKNLPRLSTFRSDADSIHNAGKNSKSFNRQSLVFKSAYSQGGILKNTRALLDRISQYKPPFFKGLPLMAILLSSFIFLIFLIVLFLIVL